MASKYPSSYDQDTLLIQNDLHLCPIDQQNPGSCRPNSCHNLHMCCNYLLNSQCPQFELNGKCSHSHSLYTLHNQKIIAKKLRLSATDEQAFEKISQLIRTSISNSSEKTSSRFERSSILDDDREVELTSKQTSVKSIGRGRGRIFIPEAAPEPSSSSLFNSQSSTNEKKIFFSQRLLPSSNPGFSQSMKSNSIDFSSNPGHNMTTRSIDVHANQFDRKIENERNPLTRHSLVIFTEEQNEKFTNNDQSSFSDDPDEKNDMPSIAAATSRKEKFSIPFVLRNFQTKKEKNPSVTDPDDSVRSATQMKYIFNKYFKDDELCYLFGPGRRHLIEHEKYQILPSGYCRLANTNEEKQIEQRLQVLLPTKLKIDDIQLTNHDLELLICTSAAERLFEQNQMDYGIISKPYTVSFSIEVINAPKSDRTRSRSVPSRYVLASSSSIDRENSHLSLSDGKFRVPITNSSIDVICGDITQTSIDLMVCVSTSYTLLNSVLSRVGSSIASQYRQSCLKDTIILDGGYTSARKILFVTWKLEVQSSNTIEAQKSLSNLVKRCIDHAYQLNMKSISFPSIGTGEIGLDATKVCESMISAASESLHQYKMDVLFVIYPSTGSQNNQQSYQVFRTYLDNLCKQSRSTRAETPSITHVPQSLPSAVETSRNIHRNQECKRISTVSTLSDVTQYHKLLVKSLEKLIVERIFNLSSIQPSFTDRVELLIDICLNYHVLPRINFAKGELTLRGDRDSCSQCFANLQKQRLIHKYIILSENGRKSEETKLNMYVSMKIDEAFANGDSNIRIEDDNKTTFDIDLKSLQVHINGDPQFARLYSKQISDPKMIPPKSWSSSLLMIRTVEIPRSSFKSLECAYVFEQTMSKSIWSIERIDAIENWPLYVHYVRKKNKDQILAFHGCSFSSVQSIIHYGLHSNNGEQLQNSICLTRDALNSHICGSRRSTDGTYYIFAVQLSKKIFDQDFIYLSNKEAYLALPIYLIIYRQRNNFL